MSGIYSGPAPYAAPRSSLSPSRASTKNSSNADTLVVGSIVISSIAMIVLTALTMSGHLTPLVGGSAVLTVGALSGLIESICLAKKNSLPFANHVTKIAFTAIYCTLSALVIAGILTPTQCGIGMLTTLGSVGFVQVPLLYYHDKKEQMAKNLQMGFTRTEERRTYETWLKENQNATPEEKREKRNDIRFRFNKLLLDNHPYKELHILYERSTDEDKKSLRNIATRFFEIYGYEHRVVKLPVTEHTQGTFLSYIEIQVHEIREKDRKAYFEARNANQLPTFEDRSAYAKELRASQQ